MRGAVQRCKPLYVPYYGANAILPDAGRGQMSLSYGKIALRAR